MNIPVILHQPRSVPFLEGTEGLLCKIMAVYSAILIQFSFINMFSPKTAQPTSRPSDLLSLYRLPARLDAAHTAALLGFQPHDISVLVRLGLLRPLGRPAPNSVRYFAAVEIDRLREDRDWLDKATRAVGRKWQEKNRTAGASREQPGQSE